MNDVAVPVGLWEFFNPDRLWAVLAIPVMALLYVILLRLKRNRGIRYTQTGIVGAVLPRQSQWRRHLSVILALSSIVLIAGAWARPVGTEKVARERATVVVILDRSLSMQATDVAPTRMDASKQAAKEFIAQLPTQYNVSVVGLSASPSVLAPPTTDRAMLERVIDTMTMQEGTAIGDAIQAGISAVAMAPGDDEEDPAPAMMILLSDGQNTGGSVSPQTAAMNAASQSIPIHTIAFGTQNGYVDVDGHRENVAPDITTLAELAAMTGGQAADAASAKQLDNVYQDLQSQVGYEDVKKEVTARWALYALACALVAAMGAVSMAARWP